jgi:hypothetical protein
LSPGQFFQKYFDFFQAGGTVIRGGKIGFYLCRGRFGDFTVGKGIDIQIFDANPIT